MTMHIHADFIRAAGFVLLGSVFAGCQSPSLVGAKNALTLKSDTPATVENAPLREVRQAIPASGTVVVQDGDNLYRVATRYQVTPQSIIRDNELVVPYNLYSGQVLHIKPSKT